MLILNNIAYIDKYNKQKTKLIHKIKNVKGARQIYLKLLLKNMLFIFIVIPTKESL